MRIEKTENTRARARARPHEPEPGRETASRRRVRIGVSGWRYGPWRKSFYPEELRQREELSYASRQFGAIEINGTFYSLQRPERFGDWYACTPPEFRFAVKGSRYITHMKRLTDIDTPLANFFASGLLRLDDKLGPLLWQLPPDMRFDAARLEHFLSRLPRDFDAAADLARHHDDRLRSEPWLDYSRNRTLEHALEFRHESFMCNELVRMARRHDVALVFSHTDGRWPYVEEITAHFVYVRLHGPGELYASNYDARAEELWAERVLAWHSGSEPGNAVRITARPPPRRRARDVWVFFDNTDKRHAPANARSLMQRLSLV